MNSRVDFRQEVTEVMAHFLSPLGYEPIEDPPGFKGGGLFFFRKPLLDDICAFICFEVLWQDPSPFASWPLHFTATLWRNRGEHPRRGHGQGKSYYESWLYLDLSCLLWAILDVKVYSGPYHNWESGSRQQFRHQLNDVGEKLVQYGVPWLENPESRNPYDSWP